MLKKADAALYEAKENRGKAILYNATHEVFTKLLNRRDFEDKLQIALNTAKTQRTNHFFCLYNLDQFKVINDTCGHLAGDEPLKKIAILMYKTIRENDSFGRFDGDTFGVLMGQCTLAQAEESAEIIRKMIEGYQFHWEDKVFSVTVSVGLVCIDEHSTNTNEAFNQADAACYAAKEAGRNRARFYHENDVTVSNRKNELTWANETIAYTGDGEHRFWPS